MGTNLAKFGSLAKWAVHTSRFHYERGQIIGLWAAIETHIDVANTVAWRRSGRAISKVVPQSLRWKLELFERIHRDLVPFAALRPQALSILRELKAQQDDRHWLAHGQFLPVGRIADGWKLQKGRYCKDGDLEMVERYFSTSEIVKMRIDLMRLSARVLRYVTALKAQIAKHPADDQGG